MSNSGIAGRTNYNDWEKKTSHLLSTLEQETESEINEAKEALGTNGKYARSEAEANERTKAKEMKQVKKVLDLYQKREERTVQVLSHLLDTTNNSSSRFVTREDVDAGKRVLSLTDTTGPGHIILTEDLTNLECKVPANSTLNPKTYPQDAENTTTPTTTHSTIHGLIKLNLTNLHNLTITIRCKVITGTLEISHCSNLIVKLQKGSTIVTIQADISQNITLQFHDAPSSKQLASMNTTTNTISSTTNEKSFLYWGDDKEDRIYSAGVSNLVIQLYRDGYIDQETRVDYIENGASAVGNAKAEEVQFVTSVMDGNLITERILKAGSATGTTVTGAVPTSNNSTTTTTTTTSTSANKVLDDRMMDSGACSRPMTAREMQEIQRKKQLVQQSVQEQIGNGIKVLDKDGKEILPLNSSNNNTITPSVVNNDSSTQNHEQDKNVNNEQQEIVEEVYTGMSSTDIESTIKDVEAHKIKGNEAFAAGEYAQAVFLYSLALDRAAELPDASCFPITSPDINNNNDTNNNNHPSLSNTKQLYPRHIILSNRSASFLKLGHFEKALTDGTTAEQFDPTYVKGIFRKGLALHAMGQYQEAIQSLAKAQKLEPKNQQIKQALTFAEVRLQQEMRKRMEGI